MKHQSSTLRERTFHRFRQAINGEPMDRYAAFHYYTYPFYQKATGVDLHRYFHDPKIMFDTQMEVLERMQWCGDLCPDTGPVAECNALGGKVRFDKEGFISVTPAEVNDLEELIRIQPADPYGDNYMRVLLETLEYMCDHAPETVNVNPPFVQGPVTVAAQLRGISDFCMETITDEDMIDELLAITTQSIINFMHAMEKVMGKPLKHILIADDLSAFLSENAFHRFADPAYQKIFAEFPHVEPWLHNDARTEHIIGAIADAGFRAWQYAPQVDPLLVAERSQSRLAMVGGLSPLTMQQLSEQGMYDYAIETMRKFGGNRRFVLSAGGSLNQVSIENALAMLRATDEFDE